jgi:cell division protein FtsB
MEKGSISHKLRRSEILSTSVTEILLVLIFVILVFTHFSQRENMAEVHNKDREIIDLRKELDDARNHIDRLTREKRDLKNKLDALREQYRALASVIRKHLMSTGTLTPDKLEEALENLAFAAAHASKDSEGVADKFHQLQNKIAYLEQKNAELLAKIKELEASLGRSGDGLQRPRCMVPGQVAAIPYLFDIRVYNDRFVIEALWSSSEDLIYYSVPGVREFGRRGTFSSKQFASIAPRIYTWGMSQSPKCRFRVRSHDLTGARKDIFKKQDRLLQGSFYRHPVSP